MVRAWITDPFWFEDPDFKLNIRVSHKTFLHIVDLVTISVRLCESTYRDIARDKRVEGCCGVVSSGA
eukprot:1419806-Rhodomonas_salina.1